MDVSETVGKTLPGSEQEDGGCCLVVWRGVGGHDLEVIAHNLIVKALQGKLVN